MTRQLEDFDEPGTYQPPGVRRYTRTDVGADPLDAVEEERVLAAREGREMAREYEREEARER